MCVFPEVEPINTWFSSDVNCTVRVSCIRSWRVLLIVIALSGMLNTLEMLARCVFVCICQKCLWIPGEWVCVYDMTYPWCTDYQRHYVLSWQHCKHTHAQKCSDCSWAALSEVVTLVNSTVDKQEWQVCTARVTSLLHNNFKLLESIAQRLESRNFNNRRFTLIT